MGKLSRDAVVKRLKELRGLKYGDPTPMWMYPTLVYPEVTPHELPLAALAGAAVDYLEDEFEYDEQE